MTPNQKYTPTSEEVAAGPSGQSYKVSLTHTITGNTYTVRLEYFLPKGALPASFDSNPKTAISQLTVMRGGGTLQYQPAVYRKTSPGYDAIQAAEGGGEQTGTTVDFVVALYEAGKEFVGKAEEVVMKEVAGVEGNPLATTATSALEVVEVLNTSADYKDMVTQLDELQASAENPINPLTQKAYADDPSLKQSILDEITNVRTELKFDTAAMYLNSEVSVAAGLMGIPVLVVAMAPVTAWNSKTLNQVMKERISNIGKMVTTGTGSLNPKPGPGGTGNTAGTGSTGSSGSSGSTESTKTGGVRPGTWIATYESMHNVISPSGDYTETTSDKGTITFTVMADSSVVGTGRGHFVYHNAIKGLFDLAVTDGETDYTFSVGGTVVMVGDVVGDELVFFGGLNDQPTSPVNFTIVSTVTNYPHGNSTGGTHTSTSTMSLNAPLLPTTGEGVKLKSGGTVKTNSDSFGTSGLHITDTRTVTIH